MTQTEAQPAAEASTVRTRYVARSRTTDVPGRTINQARTNHWVIDSPSGPNEAVTTGESFVAGIAACGVSLIELHAQRKGLPFGTLAVDIDGVRTEASWPDFERIDAHFTFTGIDRAQAEEYVGVWKENCPLYRAVVKSVPVTVTFEASGG
jgi:uncharacterized OsmC-like protein